MGWDSNPRYGLPHAGFQDRCLQPLGHPSDSVRLKPTAVRRKRARCLCRDRGRGLPVAFGPSSSSRRRAAGSGEGVVIIRERAWSHGGRWFNRGGNVASGVSQRVRSNAGPPAHQAVFAWQSLFGVNALSPGAAGAAPRLEGVATRSRRTAKSVSAARGRRPSQAAKGPAERARCSRRFARRVQSLVSSSLHGGAGAGSAVRGFSGCVLSDGRGAAWALPLRDGSDTG